MIAEKEERRNPLKASIAQDLRVAGDESKKDTKKDVKTKKKLKQAGKESQGNGKPPALDAERILPRWLEVDFSFAWEMISILLISRLLFPSDWMLFGKHLRPYRRLVGTFPKTQEDVVRFVPEYLQRIERQVPAGCNHREWIDKLFTEVDRDNDQKIVRFGNLY